MRTPGEIATDLRDLAEYLGTLNADDLGNVERERGDRDRWIALALEAAERIEANT